jgi:periplasmic protein CpxP/Spy
MSLRNKIIGAGMVAALLSAVSITAVAQRPQQGTPTDRGPRAERLGRRGDREGGRMRDREMGPQIFRGLDLTDAQKEQLRASAKQNREATQSQREELRQLAEKRHQGSLTAAEEARLKALRDEIQASMRSRHASLLSILTAEQKAKLEAMREERKEHRQEMRERHREKGERRPVKPGEIN